MQKDVSLGFELQSERYLVLVGGEEFASITDETVGDVCVQNYSHFLEPTNSLPRRQTVVTQVGPA